MNTLIRELQLTRLPAWQRELSYRVIASLSKRIARQKHISMTTTTKDRPADPRTKPGKQPERPYPSALAGPSQQVGHLQVGHVMKQFTPKALFDLYCLLPNSDKGAFVKLLGSISTAEVPFVLCNELPLPEKGRFAEMMFEELLWRVFPLLQQTARELIRENPNLSDEQFDKELQERVKQHMDVYNQSISELEKAKLKEARDRKSDPETVRRNVEICNLRKQDPKKWSLGRLAKKYEMAKQSIRKILEEETKWRRLEAKG
jgi:hypothetical protein